MWSFLERRLIHIRFTVRKRPVHVRKGSFEMSLLLSWVHQLSCIGQHVCRVYFRCVLSWKLTTHLRLSGLCLLPIACIILSSLAARCLQYPFIACYPSLTLTFHRLPHVAIFVDNYEASCPAAWFSCVLADRCIVFIYFADFCMVPRSLLLTVAWFSWPFMVFH